MCQICENSEKIREPLRDLWGCSTTIGVELGGGRGKFPRLSLSEGEVPPPEDLVQSRHSEISATFEIRKKSYWPYLCVLRPVDEIYRVSQKSCPLKK